MQIQDVEKLAELSRIEIPADEKESILNDLQSIVSYIDQIEKVSVENLAEAEYPLRNVFREDGPAHASKMYTEKIINSAPETDGNFVKVQSIL